MRLSQSQFDALTEYIHAAVEAGDDEAVPHSVRNQLAEALLDNPPSKVAARAVWNKAMHGVDDEDRCTCSCDDTCPLGRLGLMGRCTKEELWAHGVGNGFIMGL